MVDFLFDLIASSLLRIWTYEAKCVQLRCFFAGGLPLCTQLYCLDKGRLLSTILGTIKLDIGLPDGEDCISLHSLVLTQYRRVTNRWTDTQIYCSIHLQSYALHSTVKPSERFVYCFIIKNLISKALSKLQNVKSTINFTRNE